MRDLSSLRDGWDERWEMETQLIRKLTVPEGVAQLESLYREFRPHLMATESLYGEQRMRDMVELQARLRKLNR